MAETSTKPYLVRALYEWCCDNGYTPYLAVTVDADTMVPMRVRQRWRDRAQHLAGGDQSLKMGNDPIEFEARFGGVARDAVDPGRQVTAIYARENGHGMAFDVTRIAAAEDEAQPGRRPMRDGGPVPEGAPARNGGPVRNGGPARDGGAARDGAPADTRRGGGRDGRGQAARADPVRGGSTVATGPAGRRGHRFRSRCCQAPAPWPSGPGRAPRRHCDGDRDRDQRAEPEPYAAGRADARAGRRADRARGAGAAFGVGRARPGRGRSAFESGSTAIRIAARCGSRARRPGIRVARARAERSQRREWRT